MFVTDDGTYRSARHAYRDIPQKLLLVLLILVPVLHAKAQDKLHAKIQVLDANREWIHLPVNKSVLIETTVPVVRQETLAKEIVDIQSISPKQVLLVGKSFGRTQVMLWSESGDREVFDVSVELETDLLQEAIRKIDPMARVQAVPVMRTVMLTGTVSDADKADRIMQVASIFADNIQNHLQVAGEQQVLLHCTVAEMSRSATRQLGFNGYLMGDNFKDFPVVSNLGGINPTSFGRIAENVGRDAPFGASAAAVGANPTMSFAFPDVQMQLFIQALRENGLLKVLAEPTLVTVSGRTASFLAGGEFPIPVPQSSGTGGGGTTITIEYKEFGARLAFEPVVLANRLIRMKIAPEVSELDFARGVQIQGFTIPGLNSRRAETTVEMGSGQTLAIAGLLSENVRALAQKVPALGDVPVLGALFQSVDYRKNTTELVILVTPEIVSPIDPSEVAMLPGQASGEPNDWQLFALGLTETDQPGSDSIWYGDFSSPGVGRRSHIEETRDNERSSNSLLGRWGVADSEENEK